MQNNALLISPLSFSIIKIVYILISDIKIDVAFYILVLTLLA